MPTRYPFEEHTKVTWVPGWDAIPDLAAPSVTVLTTGVTDLECFLTRDGLQITMNTAKVDEGGLCTRKNGQSIGNVSTDPMLRGFRDNEDGGDTFWELAVWNTKGFLVVRRGMDPDTAYAADQKVEVYKSTMGEPSPANSAENTNQTFDLPLAFADWNLKATVAAAA